MRRTLVALMTVALVVLGVTGPASADATRSFKGTATGEVTFVPAPTGSGCTLPPAPIGPWVTVSDGIGKTTHMGRVSVHFEHCSGDYIAGEWTIDGKHGDLVLSYAGPCTPYTPQVTVVECDLDFTVISGTGRFAGASGSGDLNATVYPQPTGAWPAEWSWTGKISY